MIQQTTVCWIINIFPPLMCKGILVCQALYVIQTEAVFTNQAVEAEFDFCFIS